MGNVLETAGNRFLFRQQRCEVLKDTFHDSDGNERYQLQLRIDATKTYLFAYAPTKGLVMINEKTGQSINHSDAVGAFLSMDVSDVDEVIAFIEKYGFFFSIKPEFLITSDESDKFVNVSFDDLCRYLSRIKLVFQLFFRLLDSGGALDYNELFLWTFRLLLETPKEIYIKSTGMIIRPCNHPITLIWDSYPELNQISYEENNWLIEYVYPEIIIQEIDLKEGPSKTAGDRVLTVLGEGLIDSRDPMNQYFEVTDTFSNCTELVSLVRYHEIMEAIEILDDPSAEMNRQFRARLTYLYVNGSFKAQSDREIIDFLVHVYDQVSRLDYGNGRDLVLTGDTDLNTLPAFDDRFKDALLKIARQTVKEELDYALSKVHPIYDAENMEADWSIPDLFAAMCFSVFYMKPNQSVYRLCENYNCRNMFEVSTTNRKKKYCSVECQQSVAKRNWYQKKKLREYGNKTE